MKKPAKTPTALTTILRQWPEHSRSWADQFQLGMAFAKAGNTQIAAELARVLQIMNDGADSAQNLCGEPREYARQRAGELITPDLQIDAGWQFVTLRAVSRFVLIGMLVVLGILAALDGFDQGWGQQMFQRWHVLAFVSAGIVVVLGYWGAAQLNRGLVNKALVIWIGGGLSLLCLSFLLHLLVGPWESPVWEKYLPINNLWAMSICVGLIVLLSLIKPGPSNSRHVTPTTDEQWFAQTKQVLIGRYFFMPRQAKAALAQLPQHLAEARKLGEADIAADEFGTPLTFASQLAASDRDSARRQVIALELGWALVTLWFGWLVTERIADETITVMSCIGLAVFIMLLWMLVTAMLPRHRRKNIELRLKRRRNDARVFAGGIDRD